MTMKTNTKTKMKTTMNMNVNMTMPLSPVPVPVPVPIPIEHLPPAKHLGEYIRTPPPQAKNNRFIMFIWRWHLWFECTFGLTVMEPWERMVVLTLFVMITLLVCTGLIRYFPQKIVGLQRRMVYYLWGYHTGSSAEEMPIALRVLNETLEH